MFVVKKEQWHDFSIDFGNEVHHQEIIAILFYKTNKIAMISQENGIEAMKIRLFFSEDGSDSRILPFDHFVAAIQLAKKELLNMRKQS